MTAVYPSILPPFQLDGYGYDDDDDLLRTDMDAGPSRVRRRSTQASSTFVVNSRMTYNQMAFFEAWYKHKIAAGVEPFEIDLAVGAGIVTHTARFIGKPSARHSGPRYWVMSAKIEAFERYTLSEYDLDFFTENISAADLLHTLVHVTLPTESMGEILWD